jgi:RNA-directed DNA polymerase
MLDDLDWELDRRGHWFVRYADDGRIYVRSRRASERSSRASRNMSSCTSSSRSTARRSVVDRAIRRPCWGSASSSGGRKVRVRIDQKARKRAEDRLRQLTSRRWDVSMERRIEEINRFTVGWTAG